jgi:hypothetical protein
MDGTRDHHVKQNKSNLEKKTMSSHSGNLDLKKTKWQEHERGTIAGVNSGGKGGEWHQSTLRVWKGHNETHIKFIRTLGGLEGGIKKYGGGVEYGQSTMHSCMEILQWNPSLCKINIH